MKTRPVQDTVYTDEFCKRAGRVIYALALRILKEKESAREVAQEVWLRVLKTEGQFRRQADRLTYMYRITRNECLRHLEKNRRSFEELEVERLVSAENDPHQALEQTELVREVERCIEMLPPLQAAALTLCINAELSYKEIGGVLDVTEDLVSVSISRGRTRIKKMLTMREVAL